MPNGPNLFEYATSELSQDALIAYLLAWASPESKSADSAMHQVGTAFVSLFGSKHELSFEHIENVKVGTQKNNIDVLATIRADGKKYTFVIEDKIHAGSYNDLERYLASGQAQEPESDQVLGIYFCTGNRMDFSDVRKAGFRIIDREDMLNFLEREAAQFAHNTVLRDYHAHLRAYQAKIDSYRELLPEQWSDEAWIGFYQQLVAEDRLRFGGYNYVPNPSGGFQGCWWLGPDRLSFAGQPVYLQIEQGDLNFKMGAIPPEVDRIGLLRHFCQELLAAAARAALPEIAKRSRHRAGSFMTAATVPRETWLPNANWKLAVENLLRYQQFLIDFTTQHPA